MADDLDPLFKALADPTRRAILDALRASPRTTGELAEAFPQVTRFAVMKHLSVLRNCGLVRTRAEGRRKVHTLHAVPLRKVYERWVKPFEDCWAGTLLGVRRAAEAKAEKE
ncbi:MAG: metalloregulator ArsR/SmtB family transcription factor [Planctomycetota bacterium]